jgi:NAD(P)-dependent dehydrogenase (short-subunit alcohol dehydrogenase family)
MDLGLKGKVAIITGSTEGIGKATARRFVEEGAKVAICGRRPERVAQTVAELEGAGGDVLGMAADMSKASDIERFIGRVSARFGRVDILVNNAGSAKRSPFLEIDDGTWSDDLELKLFGAIRCARLAVPHMRAQGGGRIINIANTAAKQPGAASMPTTVSRAAGLALTKALSKEYAPDNILVNAICIGKIKSGLHERTRVRSGMSAEEYYAKNAKDIPLGRVGETAEAANAIIFLASAAASYITGSSINVDGGLSSVF